MKINYRNMLAILCFVTFAILSFSVAAFADDKGEHFLENKNIETLRVLDGDGNDVDLDLYERVVQSILKKEFEKVMHMMIDYNISLSDGPNLEDFQNQYGISMHNINDVHRFSHTEHQIREMFVPRTNRHGDMTVRVALFITSQGTVTFTNNGIIPSGVPSFFVLNEMRVLHNGIWENDIAFMTAVENQSSSFNQSNGRMSLNVIGAFDFRVEFWPGGMPVSVIANFGRISFNHRVF